MSKPKIVIGFRVSIGNAASYGYRRLTIQIKRFVENDAAEILADTIRQGHTWDVENRVRKAQAILKETGGATYYTETHSEHELDITFQDDPESRDDWYGMRAETRFNDTCIDMMRKIRKALDSGGFGPRRPPAQAVVQALQSLKAIPVRYLNDSYGDWAEDLDFDLDKAIPPKQEPDKINDRANAELAASVA